MKIAILTYYKGSPFWRRKVDAMSDNQTIAFYMRLKKAGKV